MFSPESPDDLWDTLGVSDHWPVKGAVDSDQSAGMEWGDQTIKEWG